MTTLTAPVPQPHTAANNGDKPINLFQLGCLFVIRASYWSCRIGNEPQDFQLSPHEIESKAIASFGTKELIDPFKGRRVFQQIEKKARHQLARFSRPFPAAIDTGLRGDRLFLDAGVFRDALRVTLCAAARETTRYAINGVLLESDDDDVRLVATDGRRMAVVDLLNRADVYRGQVILPARAAQLLTKLIGKHDDACITVAIASPELTKDVKATASDMTSLRVCVAGDDWAIAFHSVEGRFPHYRDVMPKSGSKFAADRRELLYTLDAVATATNLESRGIRLELSRTAIRLSARAPQAGEASGSVDAEFLGGGDEFVITGFNPGFLRDAVKSLDDDRIVIDVQQNQLSKGSGTVFGHPALIYGELSPHRRWLLMPINLDLKPNRETLGSNYCKETKETSSTRKRKSA